ncbi:hypothetical protein NEMIN01_2368 [Nematocida minor]|uniref:uncharacterized protein n=1 Tax=Nematocida minor TaxID=1912983 RepID=UPI00221F7CB3|nr:uncharacterized protein NEMIN01_2368 [Nematocida minor]KAI5193024.1 hypothetical protein NEMIN01_2368 [Nematocida minor]
METGKRELSMVSKYIKERIQEIEIGMEVREIKEPEHVHNESFERNMRRKMRKSKIRKRVRKNSSCSDLENNDLSSEEVITNSSEKSEISLERGEERRDKHTRAAAHHPGVCPGSIVEASPIPSSKKMKCGCVSHGAKKVSKADFFSSAAYATQSSRRKSMN